MIRRHRELPALRASVAAALFVLGFSQMSLADSGNWQQRPEDNSWFNAENWSSGNIPNGLNDVAFFGLSGVTELSASISQPFSLAELNFLDNAPAYQITIDIPVFATTIDGTGTVNNSPETHVVHLTNITRLSFVNNSTAGERMSYVVDSLSQLNFEDSATAASAQIAVDNGALSFGGESTAGDAIITNTAEVSLPGTTNFMDSSNGGNATLIAMSGPVLGGGIYFFDGEAHGTTGGTCKIQVFGNGFFDISPVALNNGGFDLVTIGSLSGNGLVFLGSANLTVGSDDLSTSFSGTIQDGGAAGRTGGSLTKIGAGTLTLTGANSYTGGTTVTDGILLIKNRNGSATGTGAVQVNSGTLSGRGTIAGPVAIGSGEGPGAYLAPGVTASASSVTTLQDTLTFNADGNFTPKLNSGKARAERVIANGVTIAPGAKFTLQLVGDKMLPTEAVFTLINNSSAAPINGTFADLPEGAVISLGKNAFEVSYAGGDGNDLTLTVADGR